MYILTDVHSTFTYNKAFTEIFKNEDVLQHDKKLFFLGDLFDRGTDSQKVLDTIYHLVKNDLIYMVTGNHDEMVIETFLSSDSEKQVNHFKTWILNGGKQVIDELFPTVTLFDNYKNHMLLYAMCSADEINEMIEQIKQNHSYNYEKLITILNAFKPYYNVEIDNKLILLSHTGTISDRWSIQSLIRPFYTDAINYDMSFIGHIQHENVLEILNDENVNINNVCLLKSLSEPVYATTKANIVLLDHAKNKNLYKINIDVIKDIEQQIKEHNEQN